MSDEWQRHHDRIRRRAWVCRDYYTHSGCVDLMLETETVGICTNCGNVRPGLPLSKGITEFCSECCYPNTIRNFTEHHKPLPKEVKP